MAINRGQVENFQAVVAACQANESSALGKCLVIGRDVVTRMKALIDSDAIELPAEVADVANQQMTQMNNIMSQYEEAGAQVAKANQKMNDMIMRTMGKGQQTGADAAARSTAAAKTMDEVKGGVQVG